MTRLARSVLTFYLAGQILVAAATFALVARAPDPIAGAVYIMAAALLSVAVTAAYILTAWLTGIPLAIARLRRPAAPDGLTRPDIDPPDVAAATLERNRRP